jgi:mannosyltransferase OCH1-like enzyme
MIPKIIHLVWFGGERPKIFDKLVQKIKEINYDYNVIEWNNNNINFDLINERLFNSCKNLGAKSDIFRFEVLYKFGGIYMDYDFLQIKKFDDLLDCDFFAGSPEHLPNETWNSIVGSAKDNQICKNFLDGLIGKSPINKGEIDKVMWETGPYYLHKIVTETNFNCNYKKLTGKYFYPFPATERLRIRNLSDQDLQYCESFINDDTYCIHLHMTSWQ